MTQTFSDPVVTCRPALKRDHADVKEFCKTIWNGHDYVPMVWNHWFNDPHGIFATAEYRGHAIGCVKATLLAGEQWWLEGFRVDPKHQGLKVGSHIHDYVDQWWLQNGNGMVRLMTSAKNIHVHHLCNKLGYKKIGEALGFMAEPLHEEIHSFESTNNLKQIAAFIRASESMQNMNQLADFGWRFAEVTEGILEEFSLEGADFGQKTYWWKEKQAVLTTWEDDDDGVPVLGVGAVACHMQDMSALLKDIRRLAARGNYRNVFWIANTYPQLFPALEEAGYQGEWENAGYIFEKQHAKPSS